MSEALKNEEVELVEVEEETEMATTNNEVEVIESESSNTIAKVGIGAAVLVGGAILVKKFVAPKIKSGIEKMKAKRAAKAELDEVVDVDSNEFEDAACEN